MTEGLAAMGRCHEMAEPVGAVTGGLAAKDKGQWAPAMGPGCKLMLKRNSL